jgi:hypothetical protein
MIYLWQCFQRRGIKPDISQFHKGATEARKYFFRLIFLNTFAIQNDEIKRDPKWLQYAAKRYST